MDEITSDRYLGKISNRVGRVRLRMVVAAIGWLAIVTVAGRAEVLRDVLVSSGDVLPGTVGGIGEINSAAQNGRGEVAFSARGATVDFAGVWVASDEGVRLELLSGQEVAADLPGVLWAFGATARFRSVDINDSRQLVAIGDVAGVGVDFNNDSLIVRRSGGVNSRSYRTGDLAPGGGGEAFDYFTSVVISRTDEGPVVVGGETAFGGTRGVWSWVPTPLGADRSFLAIDGFEVSPNTAWSGPFLFALTPQNQALVGGVIFDVPTGQTVNEGVFAIGVGSMVPLLRYSLETDVVGVVPATPAQSMSAAGVSSTGIFAFGVELPGNPARSVLLQGEQGSLANVLAANYADGVPGGPWETSVILPFLSLNARGDLAFRAVLSNGAGISVLFLRSAEGVVTPAYYPGQLLNLNGAQVTVSGSFWVRNAMAEDGSAVALVSTTDDRYYLIRTRVDTGAPQVVISGKKVRKLPAARRTLRLRGRAIDAGTIDRVEVKVGRAQYRAARGTESWTFVARRLTSPRTVVRVRAIDADQQSSPVARIRIVRR